MPTTGKSHAFTGRITHVSPENPSFLLLAEVHQNQRPIECEDGIWLRSPWRLRTRGCGVGDCIKFKGHTKLGQSAECNDEWLLILSCDLQIIDTPKPTFHDFIAEQMMSKHCIFDHPIPEIQWHMKPTIEFTGKIKGIKRSKAEELAEELGCQLPSEYYSHGNIDYLIVGEQGSDRYAFGEYGYKTYQALERKQEGADIKIIAGQEFLKQANQVKK